MQFSDSSNKQGIIEEIDFFVNTDSNSYQLVDKMRNINRWYEKVIGWIIDSSSSRLQFDDSKYTTAPVATADLITGQAVYPFDESWLTIDRIDLLMGEGWTNLQSFDQSDITGGYDAYLDKPGTPQYFDIQGSSFILKPAPSYDQANGLKVWFTRKGKLFNQFDNEDEPGFVPQFHRILSLGAAYDYAISRAMPQAQSLRAEIEQLHSELEEFYGWQNRERLRITPKINGYNHH